MKSDKKDLGLKPSSRSQAEGIKDLRDERDSGVAHAPQNDKRERYDPSKIESKWQKLWKEKEIYKFVLDKNKEKYYPLVELPYPSGDLHIGHWFSFATADVHARVARMMGKNVFFTNGFDAFGLPAENAAIKRGVHPKDWTYSNIETMTKQFQTMGTMIDWSHEAIACDPEYYKWNQWIFIKMYEKGLVYRGKMLGNWCPTDQTVLANEHVENGKCWRCGTEVVQKEIEQWFIKLTEYADQLIWPSFASSFAKATDDKEASDGKPNEKEDSGLKPSSRAQAEGIKDSRDERDSGQSQNDKKVTAATVDWPVSVKVAQNQWIGRKEGIIIKYQILPISNTTNTTNKNTEMSIDVFTTRPDTNFGATFIALAPEHKLVKEILNQVQDDEKKKEIKDYVEQASKKSDMDRQLEAKDKTGVFTGFYAINQLNGYKMPIWISDFVLVSFGTGALVGVPGHDKRDFEFASKFGIEIKRVVVGKDGDKGPITKLEQIQEEEGTMINSDFLNGMDIHDATQKIMDYIVEKGYGKKTVTYHIHDWSISRQRYWGTPVPMIHCEKDGIVPADLSTLPIELPYDVDFQPKGEPPLASNKEWLKTTCPKCGGPAERDAETLDTFFDSSWYFYRYLNPQYNEGPFNPEDAKNLMPVDIYFGGAEHTLGHTLYARFFTKFFKDLGLVNFDEFAKRRVQHGVILGTDGNRMSKSKGNVVNPDDVVKEYGADATRMYLCFMMPYEATAPWDSKGIWGVYKFLKKVWEMQYQIKDSRNERDSGQSQNDNLMTSKDLYMMHTTIKKVADDVMSTKFNTAVSAMMIWLNHLESKELRAGGKVSLEEYKNLLLLLAPFAPHMTEEIWQNVILNVMRDPQSNSEALGDFSSPAAIRNDKFQSIHQQSWPEIDNKYLSAAEVVIVVQVNGRVRDQFRIESQELRIKEKIEELAKKSEKVAKHLEGKTIKQIIYVPGKILNFVLEN